MATVKRIGLPVVGTPRSPDVTVLNGVSTRMAGLGLIGAIGALSGSVVRGNRSDALVGMMAARGFDPGPALTAMLTAALGAKGFTVVPEAADPKRRFLPAIAAMPDCDAVLDCYISTYGFVAASDADDSPYRATIAVPARLIGSGGAVLMQDTVVVSGGGEMPAGAPARPDAPPAPVVAAPGTFLSFSDAENNPAAAIDALRAVFETAAAGVVRRIS